MNPYKQRLEIRAKELRDKQAQAAKERARLAKKPGDPTPYKIFHDPDEAGPSRTPADPSPGDYFDPDTWGPDPEPDGPEPKWPEPEEPEPEEMEPAEGAKDDGFSGWMGWVKGKDADVLNKEQDEEVQRILQQQREERQRLEEQRRLKRLQRLEVLRGLLKQQRLEELQRIEEQLQLEELEPIKEQLLLQEKQSIEWELRLEELQPPGEQQLLEEKQCIEQQQRLEEQQRLERLKRLEELQRLKDSQLLEQQQREEQWRREEQQRLEERQREEQQREEQQRLLEEQQRDEQQRLLEEQQLEEQREEQRQREELQRLEEKYRLEEQQRLEKQQREEQQRLDQEREEQQRLDQEREEQQRLDREREEQQGDQNDNGFGTGWGSGSGSGPRTGENPFPNFLTDFPSPKPVNTEEPRHPNIFGNPNPFWSDWHRTPVRPRPDFGGNDTPMDLDTPNRDWHLHRRNALRASPESDVVMGGTTPTPRPLYIRPQTTIQPPQLLPPVTPSRLRPDQVPIDHTLVDCRPMRFNKGLRQRARQIQRFVRDHGLNARFNNVVLAQAQALQPPTGDGPVFADTEEGEEDYPAWFHITFRVQSFLNLHWNSEGKWKNWDRRLNL